MTNISMFSVEASCECGMRNPQIISRVRSTIRNGGRGGVGGRKRKVRQQVGMNDCRDSYDLIDK